MSRQSPKLTAQSFVVVKNHQNDGVSVDEIQAKTGYGASTQRAVWRAADWKDFERRKRARVLKRRTKATAERTRKRAAVKQQIIERNTKRKAVKVAIADQIESNQFYALEGRFIKLSREVGTLRKEVKTLNKDVKTLSEWRYQQLPTHKSPSDDELDAQIAAIPEDEFLDADFLPADAKTHASGRSWPWTRKRG